MEMKECYRIHGRHGERNRSGRENHEIHGGTRKESAREWRESGEWGRGRWQEEMKRKRGPRNTRKTRNQNSEWDQWWLNHETHTRTRKAIISYAGKGIVPATISVSSVPLWFQSLRFPCLPCIPWVNGSMPEAGLLLSCPSCLSWLNSVVFKFEPRSHGGHGARRIGVLFSAFRVVRVFRGPTSSILLIDFRGRLRD
jgi:hypothetical protein